MYDPQGPRTCFDYTRTGLWARSPSLSNSTLRETWPMRVGGQTVWCFASLPGLHQGMRRRQRLRRFTFDDYQKSYRARKAWRVSG